MPDPRIQLLSDHVCNKIAAGEVIERPASVFKELVENAVDAGAEVIEVEVLQGGRKAVIVTDNGHGMSRENALLAIERHATSKIRDVDDIEHIHTMGFRGEALAAIAAVSRFSITTRRPDDLSGTEIIIEGGTLRDVRDTGCPPGTTMEVRNLFFNVPARKKFLRTEATELANIRTLFRVFALAHPNVDLKLSVDGKLLEHHARQTSLADRIAEIYGDPFLAQLRPVDFHQGDLHVHGYTGLPTLHRSDRKEQVVLVNRRPASAPIVGFAIREAYRDTLPRDRNPVLFLHLDMPPDWVDVNVHPTKREVRFRPAQLLRDTVHTALESALHGTAASTAQPDPHPQPTPQALPPRLTPEMRQSELPAPPAQTDPAPVSPPLHPSVYPPVPPPPPAPPRPSPASTPPEANRPPTPQTSSEDAPPPRHAGPWQHADIIGVTGNRFCLLETEDGLVIMDPGAALERVLYEKAMREMENRSVATQALLIPETLQCTPEEAARLRERMQELQELGFSLDPFGGDTFLVEAVPAWLGDLAVAPVLKGLTGALDSGARKPDTPKEIRNALARSCCRMAAEMRGKFRTEELQRLVRDLETCRMPYTTPFGRPTLIHMGFRELRRKFGLET